MKKILPACVFLLFVSGLIYCQAGSLTLTRICLDCSDVNASVHPDGEFMISPRADEISIRNLQTARQSPLTFSGRNRMGIQIGPRLSPDMQQVAFISFAPGQGAALQIAPNDAGSLPRVLVANTEFNSIAWAPDGKSILAIRAVQQGGRGGSRSFDIVRVSAADGTVIPIKSLGSRVAGSSPTSRPPEPSASPDGQYIAYSAYSSETNPRNGARGPADQHIYVVRTDGSGQEIAVVKRAGINESPVWTPDGAQILFISDFLGDTSLWSIAVRDGRAEGQPSRVLRNTGRIAPNGMTRSGIYYYTQVRTGSQETFVAEIEMDGGATIKGVAARFVHNFSGSMPSWSPDGKLLGVNDSGIITVYSLDSGERKIFQPAGINLRGSRPLWLHDNSGFLTIGVESGSNGSANLPFLYRADVKDGKTEKVSGVSGLDSNARQAALSPDDKTLYKIVENRILAVALATGEQRPVFTLPMQPVYLNAALSPDGRTLALVAITARGAHIDIIGVDGNGYRRLHSDAQNLLHFTWTNDSLGILAARGPGDAPESEQNPLLYIPVTGGTPRSTGLQLDLGGLQGISLSPDGSRLAYSRSLPATSELWSLDLSSILKPGNNRPVSSATVDLRPAAIQATAPPAATQTGVTGKWSVEAFLPATVTLDLTAKETTLSGTVTQNGVPVEISEGKIDGDKIAFKVTTGGRIITFAGKLNGDTIDFTRTVDIPAGNRGPSGIYSRSAVSQFTAKRVRG